MERKLASIQRIVSVAPIEGADRIEQIQVLGWKLVARKGEFKPNDLCVYFEIDSVLPERPEFEFLRNKKFRIKTMKMRGAISQGLAMPISILPKEVIDLPEATHGLEGLDVTELLGIKKYEPPVDISLGGLVRRQFPSFVVPKTDEIRLQSTPEVLKEFQDIEFYATVKLDGMSATYYLLHDDSIEGGEDFGVCSRNLELKPDDKNALWKLAAKYNIRSKLLEFLGRTGRHLAIQGEVCGPKVAGNRMKLSDIDLFIFNMYDIDQRKYLDFVEFLDAAQQLGLKTVPIVGAFPSDTSSMTVDDWLKYVDRDMVDFYPAPNRPGQPIEGMVVRPTHEKYSEVLAGRLSFKVVNNRYLLAHEE